MADPLPDRSQSGPPPYQPCLKRKVGRKPVWHGALLGALAQHAEHPPTPIHVTDVQSDELADPNTCGVEHLEDQPVPEFECLVSRSFVHRAGLALGHQGQCLVVSQDRGECAMRSRARQRAARIVGGEPHHSSPLSEGAGRGSAPRQRRTSRPRATLPSQPATQHS